VLNCYCVSYHLHRLFADTDLDNTWHPDKIAEGFSTVLIIMLSSHSGAGYLTLLVHCGVHCRLLSALGLSDEADTPATAAAAAGGSNGGSSGSSGALAALAGSAEARGHVFSALAQLANRMPDLFQVRWGDFGCLQKLGQKEGRGTCIRTGVCVCGVGGTAAVGQGC
jgi:hypothetical protein